MAEFWLSVEAGADLSMFGKFGLEPAVFRTLGEAQRFAETHLDNPLIWKETGYKRHWLQKQAIQWGGYQEPNDYLPAFKIVKVGD